MKFEQPDFHGKTMFPLSDVMGNYMQNPHIAHVFKGQPLPPGNEPPMPYHNINVQPRKFIIFDQTRNGRHVVFNTEITPSFVFPGFGVDPIFSHENIDKKDGVIDEGNVISSSKEDSDNIDALLSTEYEENQECNDDDDVVSTARNDARYYDCDSPDSCSNYETTPSAKKSTLRKRRRIRKMVMALKEIVPGAKHMSALNVLDEAVRYLKSLRVKAQKMGAENDRN